MKFKDLLRLCRDDRGNRIPEEILRKLKLPVPEGVFEQLIRDHATTPFAQHCYGELDLHAIRWEEAALSASSICAAAVHKSGAAVVMEMDAQMHKHVKSHPKAGKRYHSGRSRSKYGRSTRLGSTYPSLLKARCSTLPRRCNLSRATIVLGHFGVW